jgi:putative peptidoglycan lipid II flippase
MKETKLPVFVAAGAMVSNIILNLLLMIPLRQGGLALASSLSSTLNLALLWILLEKRIGGLDRKTLSAAAAKIFLLSGLMGVCVYLLHALCGRWVNEAAIWGRLIDVSVPLVGGVVFYLAAASLMKLEEANQKFSLLRRRLNLPSASSSR